MREVHSTTDDDLIARYVVCNPHRPGLDRAELKDSGVEVWALVAYYEDAAQEDVDCVARAYAVPREAVEAALAYYKRHRSLIDARLTVLRSV